MDGAIIGVCRTQLGAQRRVTGSAPEPTPPAASPVLNASVLSPSLGLCPHLLCGSMEQDGTKILTSTPRPGLSLQHLLKCGIAGGLRAPGAETPQPCVGALGPFPDPLPRVG